MRLGVLTLILFLLTGNGPTWAFCSEPSAPRFSGSYKPDEPRVPFCVNKYANTHTCSDWEIDSYNRDVESYNDDLRRYQQAVQTFVDDLNAYVSDAVEFAKCSVREVE